MTDQQKELIVNMAKYVLAKCMRDRVEVVSFNDIASHCSVSARGVRVVSKYICKVLMTSVRVAEELISRLADKGIIYLKSKPNGKIEVVL